jgi:hypothetical protein
MRGTARAASPWASTGYTARCQRTVSATATREAPKLVLAAVALGFHLHPFALHLPVFALAALGLIGRAQRLVLPHVVQMRQRQVVVGVALCLVPPLVEIVGLNPQLVQPLV